MITRTGIVLLTLGLAACGARGSSSDASTDGAVAETTAAATALGNADTSVIRLERATCYGRCPAYVVELFGDGAVRFEGRQHVPVEGVQQARVDALAVQTLLEQFERSGFVDADSAYVQESANCGQYFADGPQFTLTANIGTRRKVVQLDAGCTAAPRFLNTLAAAVDSVAQVSTWIPSDGVPQ